MNSDVELIKYAKQLKIPLRFIGNKDNLKNFVLQNGGYIVNIQDDYRADGEDQGGTHWVSFWVEKNKAVYFNSFGMSPPAEVQLFLWHYKPYSYNNNQIQNIQSGWCGIYVIAFLHWMNTHKQTPVEQRFKQFIHLFSDDPTQNLSILKKIMGKHFF